MRHHPWAKLWCNRWRGCVRLKACKWEGKGLLADLITWAHHGDPKGYVTVGGKPLTLEEIAKECGETLRKAERVMQALLRETRVIQDESGTYIVPFVLQQALESQQAYIDGKKGGSPALKGKEGPPLKPEKKETNRKKRTRRRGVKGPSKIDKPVITIDGQSQYVCNHSGWREAQQCGLCKGAGHYPVPPDTTEPLTPPAEQETATSPPPEPLTPPETPPDELTPDDPEYFNPIF